MELIADLKHMLSVEGIQEMIRWGGLLILIAIVFSETGLLVGFFLPGDSLLVVAGFMAATTDILNIWQLIPALAMASIVGDSVGYLIGYKAGVALYNRPQSRWFRRDHLLRTKGFYEKYGAFTIVLARFVPFARTFAPTVAGIGQMNYPRFFLCTVLGGLGWVTSMSLVGYFFGQIPVVQRNIDKFVLLIILVSVIPVAIQAWKASREPAVEV